MEKKFGKYFIEKNEEFKKALETAVFIWVYPENPRIIAMQSWGGEPSYYELSDSGCPKQIETYEGKIEPLLGDDVPFQRKVRLITYWLCLNNYKTRIIQS